jgi:hypothetical protein
MVRLDSNTESVACRQGIANSEYSSTDQVSNALAVVTHTGQVYI